MLDCAYFLKNLQDEMMDPMDVSNEIQESLGRSYSVPDDVDEEELMGGKLIWCTLIPVWTGNGNTRVA